MIQVKEGADVDIGANASAEEAADDLEDGVTIVNNVVYSFRLQSTNFDKKGYTSYVKGYLKKLKEALKLTDAEEIKKYEDEMKVEVMKVIKNFGDYEVNCYYCFFSLLFWIPFRDYHEGRNSNMCFSFLTVLHR